MKNSRAYHLIHKNISSQLSPTERQEYLAISQSPGFKELEAELSSIWSASKEFNPVIDWKIEEAKQQFKKSLAPKPEVPVVKDFWNYTKLSIVALTIAGLLFVIWMINTNNTAKEVKSYENIEFAVLDDNSEVWLGNNSTLQASISTDKRNVTFSGEAFFQIAKNPEVPFVMDLGGFTRLEVIGTSFRVKNNPNTGEAEVLVREGEVKLYNTKNNSIELILSQGEKGVISPVRNSSNKEAAEQFLALDSERAIDFKNGSLIDFFDAIGLHYGYKVKMDRAAMKNCRYTSPMTSKLSLDQVIAVVKESYPTLILKFSEGSNVELSGVSCEPLK